MSAREENDWNPNQDQNQNENQNPGQNQNQGQGQNQDQNGWNDGQNQGQNRDENQNQNEGQNQNPYANQNSNNQNPGTGNNAAPFKITGSWEQQATQLKEKYNELTDSDLQFEPGKENQLLDQIGTKLNKSRDEVITIINQSNV